MCFISAAVTAEARRTIFLIEETAEDCSYGVYMTAKYNPATLEELKTLVSDPDVNLGDIDTTQITSMEKLFRDSNRRDFSGIETWNTSHVKCMKCMFQNAEYFNHPIGNWDTSSVTDMQSMFRGAVSFNQPLANWDTSRVKNMKELFLFAKSFNQPIGSWNTSAVTSMKAMFCGAESFN